MKYKLGSNRQRSGPQSKGTIAGRRIEDSDMNDPDPVGTVHAVHPDTGEAACGAGEMLFTFGPWWPRLHMDQCEDCKRAVPFE